MENNQSIKGKIIKNLVWKFLERGGVQGVQFVIQIVLARILTPSDYGVTGIITVFIAIANVFVQSGLGSALIQKKDTIEEDYSSVFYLNILISLVMIGILFIAAPAISSFYQMEILIPVLRVQSLILVFNAFNVVQNAVLQKNMQFKKLFYASLGAITISGVFGIFFAYLGAGVWALVFQQLINALVTSIILWIIVKWRPKHVFKLENVRHLFKFGSRLLCSGLIDTLYNNIYPLIIGKAYSQEDLGYYNRGYQIPSVLVNNINGSIQGVLFPAFAEYQDNRPRLKQLVRRSIVTSSFLVFPVMAGLAACSEPLTVILLTDKWLPSVPFMQLSCIIYAFWPIHTANLQAINAVGRSDVFLKLEIIKKAINIGTLFITVPMGIYPMLIGSCCTSFVSAAVNAWPNKKLLGYSYFEQIKDILPSLILSIIMCVLCFSVFLLHLGTWATLIVQIIAGTFFYITAAWLLKLECFTYLLNTIKSGLRLRKEHKHAA
ncbi:polysaccharide biosynthesis protein [Eubacterium limosum]|nr:polysaccharide biosynthesis protein [Eubacterium limosum]